MNLKPTKFSQALANNLQKSAWRLVFGGSFNPPHFGHISTVKQLNKIFRATQFDILPCNVQAFKQDVQLDNLARLQMLQICKKYMSDAENIFIDTREIDRAGISYTYDTLLEIRSEIGQAVPLGFVIGGDLLPSLHKWHNIEKFSQLTNLIIIKRPGAKLQQNLVLETFERLNGDNCKKPLGVLAVLELKNSLNISSSFVRSSLARGQNVDMLIPRELKQYIYNKDLYKNISI